MSAVSLAASCGRRTADVGTDHAYIPAYLILSGMRDFVVASDVVRGPLENAAGTLRKYGIEDRVELRLSDGLKAFDENEVDEIIICGMGGDLISGILSACPWIRNGGIHLVLQPMSHVWSVRRFLAENGYETEKEICCEEGNKLYVALSAYSRGNFRSEHPGYYRFGKLSYGNPLEKAMLEKEYAAVVKRRGALRENDPGNAEIKELDSIAEYYENKYLR